MGSIDDLHESGIDSAGKSRMGLDGRAQLLDGRCVSGFDGDHGVRVANRDRANGNLPVSHLQPVGIDLRLGLERQAGRVEIGRAHVDGHNTFSLDARTNEASGAVHRHITRARQATLVQQSRDTARSVAALLNLRAVRVEDSIEHRRGRVARRLEEQRLIEADAGVAVGELAQLIACERGLPGGRIDHNEIVSEPVHLREFDAHPPHRIAESPQCSTVSIQATVHDSENAGALGTLGGLGINHAVLQPKGGKLESDTVGHDSCHVLGTPEHVDDVHALLRPEHFAQVIEVRHGPLPENIARSRCDRNDSVAVVLQSLRYVMAGACRLRREANNRDDACSVQESGNLVARGVLEHRDPPKACRMTEPDYTVRIEPHGRVIRALEGRPILEGALEAGLNLPHSCKSGHCGSCRARLLSGEVSYPQTRPLGLSTEEAEAGYILLCQARARSDLVVEARLIASVADVDIKTLPCRIDSHALLAPDVLQVFLRLPAVETLHFQPGQYLDVLLDEHRRRSFSIASPPHDSRLLELHVRRVTGGGFTQRLFESPAAGMLLRIEGPIGQFVYRPGNGPIIMIAGGTGFAPLKSMLRHVIERGARRDIHLFWGARQARDVYEEGRVLEWAARFPQLRFTAVLSEASQISASHQRLGWVHEAVLAEYPDLAGYEVYAAGPPALIEAIRATFPRHGALERHLYFDSFDYAPDSVRAPARGAI